MSNPFLHSSFIRSQGASGGLGADDWEDDREMRTPHIKKAVAMSGAMFIALMGATGSADALAPHQGKGHHDEASTTEQSEHGHGNAKSKDAKSKGAKSKDNTTSTDKGKSKDK